MCIRDSAYSGAVRYKGTYGINALLYCQGMKKVLKEHGVVIHEASEVIGWKEHTVRTHLGAADYDAAWAEGRQLAFEQAAEEAVSTFDALLSAAQVPPEQ